MKIRLAFVGKIAFVVTLLNTVALMAADVRQMQSQFAQPPDDARIMVRWWWFGPAVTKAELAREMETMKAGGIGGFEINPVYPLQVDGDLPGLKNFKFLSPEHLDAIAFTAVKAKHLGLRMSLTLGSGWPYGGPQFSAAEGATAIQTQSLNVPAGQRRAPLPALRSGQQLIAAFAKVRGVFKSIPVVDNVLQMPDGLTNVVPVELFISRGGIMAVKRPAYGADGNVIDHYSPEVVAKFIREDAVPELQACGTNAPYSLFCDSLEVNGENWTPNFLAEFQKRRGYDLKPLLPALFNDVGPKTLDIRYDWAQTVTEMFNDNFTSAFTKLAHDNNTRFRIQAYGTPPAALFSYAYCDLPEGELGGKNNLKKFSATRWASSASHLLGRPVTSSETFTWLHSPVFRATPLDMKAEADLHFLCGINQIICHGWPYSAEGAAYPGWSFYAAAVFDDKNPWWIVMPDVTKYLQRVSYLLRQGTPANDVALFLPNSDAWANLPSAFSMNAVFAEKVGGLVKTITDSGYNLDFFDDQLLEMRGAVVGDRLAFGDVRYRVVILPGVERILPATMEMLETFARAGGIVIATRRLPDLAPGYKATDADTQTVRAIAQRLFKSGSGTGIFLEDENQLGVVLAQRLQPDVAFSSAASAIGFVHRHTDDGEIYFVANTGNQPANVQAAFRVAGLQPEIWNPLNGQTSPAAITGKSVGSTSIQLNLESYGSTVVVFTTSNLPARRYPSWNGVTPSPVDLSAGWKVRFGNDSQPVQMDKLTSWIDLPAEKNFSGVATYEKTISIAPEMLQSGLTQSFDFGSAAIPQSADERGGQGYRAVLDPPIREAAIIYVNDERVGSLWCPPYVLDVTGRLKTGDNKIRIEVANLAVNNMAGIKRPNYNYDGVTRQFGNRFQPQNLNLIQPLPSGLLGTVRLISEPNRK